MLVSEFHIRSSLTRENYTKFNKGHKNFFIGANREHITGSIINITDVKTLGFSVWDDYINNDELKEHAKNVENIGRSKPLYRKRDNKGKSQLRADSLAVFASLLRAPAKSS